MEYFIYETENLINGKKYRGLHRTNNIDDGYLGSGNAIKKSIKKYGKENFKRIILEFCLSFEELLQKEEKYVDSDWIKRNDTYNMRLGGICSTGRITPLDNESKKKISETLKEGYASGRIKSSKHNLGKKISDDIKEKISETLKEYYKNNEHSSKGLIPYNKGQKGLQEAWNKGLKTGELSEEEKQKRSDTLKEYYKNNEHHSKGKPAHNKGKKTGKPSWNAGKVLSKEKCLYCDVYADQSNLKRWHNDNCRNKKEEQ